MKLCYRLLFLCLCFSNLFSQNNIRVEKMLSGLTLPLDINHCGDDRIFVVEKNGKIKIIQDKKLLTTEFLDITDRVNARGGEQGLLGLAFDPNYANNGYFYVNYIDKSSSNGNTTISRFSRNSLDSNRADKNSEKIILQFSQPYSNHNGGCMKFGRDSFLYIGTGDGGNAGDPQGNAQNNKSFLGKMLRIDVSDTSQYKIPASNPFFANSNYLPEIWATGLRNPWRFSFDRMTGDLWIGDVGQGTLEEVDFQSASSKGGENYGWRCYEGNRTYNTSGCGTANLYTAPVYEYLHSSTTGISITGGFVYRGKEFPTLQGLYIYGDYDSGNIWSLQKSGNTYTNKSLLNFNDKQISSFGEDSKGELYFTAIVEGAIYKITDTCSFIINEKVTTPSCIGVNDGQIEIIANSNYKFQWSTGDTGTTIRNLSSGIYSVEVINGICKTTKQFVVPPASSKPSCITPVFRQEVCANDSALLIACDEKNVTKHIWRKNQQIDSSYKTKRIAVRESGFYSYQYIDSMGCISSISDSVEITVFPLPPTPEIKLSSDSLFGPEQFKSYRWFLNGQFFASSVSNFILLKQSGKYCLTVIDSNFCESEKSKELDYIHTNTFDLYSDLKLVPNPISNSFFIQSPERIKLQIVIEDINQKIWLKKDIYTNEIQNVNTLPPASYFMKIRHGGKNLSLQFIKN